MNCGEKGYLGICLFWLAINAGFELGQKYSVQVAALVPDWFEGVFLLENTKSYFLHGTYCHLDMAAIILGGVFAYLFWHTTTRTGGSYETQYLSSAHPKIGDFRMV